MQAEREGKKDPLGSVPAAPPKPKTGSLRDDAEDDSGA
jgi:hypothetical protein